MDYRALLKQYMRAVIDAEGVSFVGCVAAGRGADELAKIEAEIVGDLEALAIMERALDIEALGARLRAHETAALEHGRTPEQIREILRPALKGLTDDEINRVQGFLAEVRF